MTADPYDVAHEAALVGTGRARAADVEQAAARLLGPSEASPPWRLLELAAAVTRVRRATAAAVPAGTAPPVPAPPQHREIRRASRTALEVALAEEPLQAEALTWVADLALALDADAVVRVLELGTAKPGLRAAASRALGARGQWLAAHNSAWSWVGARPDTGESAQRWDHATADERLVLLRELRAEDPARGRDLLQRSAATERADVLARMLAQLETGLSAADEPFLEQLLDDKRIQVRRAAAALLVDLPGSALVERATHRAGRYLQVTGRLRKQLAVRPPEQPDDEMTRDAVSVDVLPQLGRSASLLAHDLARVPPARLRELLGLDTGRLLSLAAGSDWWPSLRHALLESARRWGDTEVLVALLPHVPFPQVASGLREDAAVATLVTAELRRSDQQSVTARAMSCLTSVPPPWGPRTAAALWPALLQALDGAERGRPAWTLGEAARAAARSLPVDGPPPPLDPARYTNEVARRAADTVVTTFAVRQRLRTALLDDAHLHDAHVHQAQENP